MTHSRTLPIRSRLDALDDRINPAPALLLSNNALIPFDTNLPGATAGAAITVTGLGAGENLVGIDVRPQTGGLYGLTTDGAGSVRLYAVSRQSGLATPLTAGPVRFDDGAGNAVNVTGTNFGVDFNPTVDRLRVVTDTGFNFRINPNTGLLIDGNNGQSTAVNGTNPDGALNGGSTKGDATAYTNSSPNVTATTQYTLDASTDKLFVQNPPNAGTLTNGVSVTLAGAGLDFTAANGFDIPPTVTVATSNAGATGKGLALLTVGSAAPTLYQIDLASGAATKIGAVGTNTNPAQGFALLGTGTTSPLVAFDGTNVVRFNSAAPGTVTKAAVTGVTAGETLVGIDLRPATGQLYGLGVNATADTATLYVIDPQGGAATVVGTAGGVALVDAAGKAVDLPDAATGYGIDFNPAVDKLRVVTGSGLNFRVNAATGVAVDGDANTAGTQPDAALNGGATAGTATAYTNSFAPLAGAGVTTQYTLDSVTDKLFVQNPPNAGTLTNGVSVSLNGTPLDFSAANAFDIPSSVTVGTSNAAATGKGLAALTVGGTTALYQIDLATGAATKLGNIGDGSAAITGLTGADVVPAPAAGAVGGAGFAVGSDAGRAALVRTYDSSGTALFEVSPFGTFTGGVRVASGDFNGDGVTDVAAGTGPGQATSVRVFSGVDGTTELFSVAPFEAAFTGGVYVAAGDLNGDGKADLIVTPDQGGGPRVDIYTGGATFAKAASFFGIDDANFRGGARAATGDVNGDGRADLLVAAGFGGGPRVAVFNGTTATGTPVKLFNDFFAFEQTLRNGVFIAAGDIDADGKAEVIAGGGPGGGPRVTSFSAANLISSGGATLTQVSNFFAGDATNRGGVRVAARNLDNDARADLIVGGGTGAGSRTTAYLGSAVNAAQATPSEAFAFDAFAGFTGGVFVG